LQNILPQGRYDKAWHLLIFWLALTKCWENGNLNTKAKMMEKGEGAKAAIVGWYIPWTRRNMKKAQIIIKSKNMKTGQWKVIMKYTHSRQDRPDQVFSHARRSIVLTRTFHTLTPLKDVTNGNPQTGW
jgi:hypothetical protein